MQSFQLNEQASTIPDKSYTRGAGLVARLHLKHHIPYGLHGSFTNEVFAANS
jgi:carotenoid cleavage dioxygenase-like enzyme